MGALIIVIMAWRSVNPGYVGVVFDKVNHRVTAGVLEPGWAIINPFTQSIQEYPVTIQTYAMVQKSSEGQVTGRRQPQGAEQRGPAAQPGRRHPVPGQKR